MGNILKAFYKPEKIGTGGNKASWEDYQEQKDDVVVEMDPGMAFGTGIIPPLLCASELWKNTFFPSAGYWMWGQVPGFLR